jgi:hypothetical protein
MLLMVLARATRDEDDRGVRTGPSGMHRGPLVLSGNIALGDPGDGFRRRLLLQELFAAGTDPVVPAIPTVEASIAAQALGESGEWVVLGWR